MARQTRAVAGKKKPRGKTCGPCHPDAACINGCTPGSDRVTAVLKDVTGYKNPEVILRIMDKVPCSKEEAEALFEEMKQYLARSAVSKKRSSPTKRVDIAWHEFILFTIDYARFCREHFGRFIHHVPTPRLSGPAVSVESCDDCSGCLGCEDCAPEPSCDAVLDGK